MNNKEERIKQFFNKADHPKDKTLKYAAHWINSEKGMVWDFIAIVTVFFLAATCINDFISIRNLISLTATVYVAFYEAFALGIVGVANNDGFAWSICVFVNSLIIFVDIICQALGDGPARFYPVYNLVSLMYIFCFQGGLYFFLDAGDLYQFRFIYLKRQLLCKKIFRLLGSFFVKNKKRLS